jgi:hypothetical protein
MSSVAAIINTAKDIPSTDFFNTHGILQQLRPRAKIIA